MSIVINQSVPLVAVQGVAADVVLQPGSVISARVVQVVGNDQVRIAIGGQSIDVLSQVPLQAGNYSAAVDIDVGNGQVFAVDTVQFPVP